jgi:hypothetical protein
MSPNLFAIGATPPEAKRSSSRRRRTSSVGWQGIPGSRRRAHRSLGPRCTTTATQVPQRPRPLRTVNSTPARLTDRASAAATTQDAHYPTFLRAEAPGSCTRLLGGTFPGPLWCNRIARRTWVRSLGEPGLGPYLPSLACRISHRQTQKPRERSANPSALVRLPLHANGKSPLKSPAVSTES